MVRTVIDFMISQDFGKYTFEYLFNFKYERLPTSWERDEFYNTYDELLEESKSYDDSYDSSNSY